MSTWVYGTVAANYIDITRLLMFTCGNKNIYLCGLYISSSCDVPRVICFLVDFIVTLKALPPVNFAV